MGTNEEERAHQLLLKQLEYTIALAAKQDQVVWVVFSVFGAAEAVLVSGLFQNGTMPTPPVGFFVSVAGFAISLVWARIQSRAMSWLQFYERVIATLEEMLKVPDSVVLALPEARRKKEIEGEPVRSLMTKCGNICAGIWLLASVGWLMLFGKSIISIIADTLLSSKFLNPKPYFAAFCCT